MQSPSSLLAGISDNPPQSVTLGQDKFDRGVISLINESKLPRNALKEADNLTLTEDGAPKIRPGIDWYGTAPSAFAIEGADMFVASDDSVHLIVVSNGAVWRSTDNGQTWDACSSGSFTAGKRVRTVQANNYSYLFNGYDNIIRYNGSTTLVTYTALTTPVGNVPTKTGLGATTYTYRYRVSAVNDVGYTIASTAQVIQVDRQRDQWNDTNFVTFTWTAVAGAVRYDIYVGQIAGEESYIDSTEGNANVTYIDKGAAIEQVAVVAPDSNTTQGPRAGDMAMIGTRLFATADRDFPYRVWISGAGRFVGQFSSAYDATYIDLQKGGQFKPVKVEDYRDGKGTPLATVWCKSKDGRGCIWQGSLDSLTVGDITFPVPNFYRLPGSRGTDAPDSVVNVLNDYMYYNSQAFFNLGSRAQFLNLLSTDESSANIRPDVQRIRQSASSKICAHFQDAKVYFSVPIDSDENNRTIIFDTERKAWLPHAFTVGFKRFFSYTDTAGTRHLLAWKPGDTRLSQISPDIKGDYGVPFRTSLITGLQHVNPKNRFEFLWCEEGEIEVAQPAGEITIELSGITRSDGFRKLDSKTIKPTSIKHSWTLGKWTTHKWTDTTVSAVSYSEPSTKRYFNVQEDINAYQYRITTYSLMADYILRTLQINGTATATGKPREWELFE
jgi:hypothetical protein